MEAAELLEPLLAFLAASVPFSEVSRLAVVSKTWMRMSLNALKTAHQLIVSGLAESVTDGVVRLALVRVTSENLRVVNLSGCHNISPVGMENILQYIAETCPGVKEVDVTACSNETILRAVATRARAALGCPLALDLFARLRSLGEGGKRYSFSNLGSLLQQAPPLLLFDPALAPRKNALFQAAAHGTGSDVALLLSLSFAVGDEDASDEDESDEDASDEVDIRTYDLNKEDSHGTSPLLLACRSGNLEIAKMLLVAGAGVSAANNRGDTPLLAAVGAGKLELAEMLVRKGANVEAVRNDGAGLLSLAIVSQQTELLNLALTCSPQRLEHQDAMSASELAAAFLDPARIEAWLRTGASPLGLAGQVGALIASCALDSSTTNRLEDVRAFLFHNLDMLQDPTKWPVKHAVQQLASQEAGTVFVNKYADRDKTAGESRFITLINKQEKHLCRSIHRAQSLVLAVCYSPDGSKLARAEGSEMVVCDASTGFVQQTLCGHSADVNSVAFSADGTVIASGSDDRTVGLWDAVTGSCKCMLIGHSQGVSSVAWSLDGTTLASGSWDKTIKVWNVTPGDSDSTTLKGDTGISCVSFSPNSSILAAGDFGFNIRLYDPITGELKSTLSGHYGPDGKQVASGGGGGDCTVKIWQVSTGSCQLTLTGHSGYVNAVAWSPDGKSLASSSDDTTVRIWDASTGQVQSTLSGHYGVVWSVCFSLDGKQVASGSDDETVRIWQTPTCHSTLTGHSNYVNAVTWSPDGSMFASGGNDKTIKLWDAQSGKVKATLSGHSSKDNLNCTCMFDKRGNFKEANPTCPVTGHIGSVLSVCFDHTGKKLASGGGPGDNSVRVWSAESGAPIGPPLNGHSDEVNGVCFSPDGSKLASCSDDRSVKIWNLITRDMIAAGCDNGTIHLLDTGTVAVKRSLSRHSGTVTQVELVHDGVTLVSGGGGTTRHWDVQSGETKEVEEVKRVSEDSMFAFSKGRSREQKVGKFLITAEGDILRIFKREDGVKEKVDKDTAPVAFFRTPAPISTVDTSGEHIVVGCQNGEVLQLRSFILLTD